MMLLSRDRNERRGNRRIPHYAVFSVMGWMCMAGRAKYHSAEESKTYHTIQ
jgi:hypothetical protein